MSTTMEGIDARGYLIGWLKGLVSMTSADIRAMPDDKWTVGMGGCTRPANAIVAETIGLLRWATGALRGETGNSDYSGGTDELPTQAVAIQKLEEVADEFCGALAAASDEALAKEITPPWQMPAPLFMIAQIAVSHVWYHDGQLNYIQCLLGDEKVHWMGD